MLLKYGYLISLFFFTALMAEDTVLLYESKPVLKISQATSEPFIDGKLSDEMWLKAETFYLKNVDGISGTPYDKTTVKIASSKSHIFLSFFCEEPKPNEIIAKGVNRDDNLSLDDHILLALSAGLEKETKPYLIKVNGNGVVFDSFNNDPTWNWQDAVIVTHKESNSWSVEMSLPFAEIDKSFKKGKIKGWRANFVRYRMARGWEDLIISALNPFGEGCTYQLASDTICFQINGQKICGDAIFETEKGSWLFFESRNEKAPEGAKEEVVEKELMHLNKLACKIPHLTTPITIDGDIRDQINSGASLMKFKMLDGTIKSIKQKTETWICTTPKSIVISVRCYDDSMAKLVSSERMRDKPSWKDDYIELFLKTEETDDNFIHLIVNAHGSIYDSLINNDNNEEISHDLKNMKVVSARKELYWDLEIEIPFEDLNIKDLTKANKEPWRFNIIRHRPAHSEEEKTIETAWAPTKSPRSFVPEEFGYLFLNINSTDGPKK